MCQDCGCQEGNERAYFGAHAHGHDHGHDHPHPHPHPPATPSAGPYVVVNVHHHHYYGGGSAPQAQGQGHAHAHGHTHSHSHGHGHGHDHDHGHGHDHGHDHSHTHTHEHPHDHDHAHGHDHDHGGPRDAAAPATEKASRTVTLESKVLAVNDAAAARNRSWLAERGVLAVNLISSPGTGKTTLLEQTLVGLEARGVKAAVIVGDQQTDNDAKRLEGKGAVVHQIETYSSCHLNAEQVEEHLEPVVGQGVRILFIENVGNLVCPAAFDLGETFKIALLSVTEGEDKPVKYPVLFHDAPVTVLTKTDLAPHVGWDRDACVASVRTVRPDATILELSARTGDGMSAWLDYLTGLLD